MKSCKSCGGQVAKGVKKCPHCGKDQRNWAGRHKVLTALGAIVVVVILVNALNGGGDSTAPVAGADAASSQAAAGPATVVTADKLVKDLEQNALQAADTYDGKRVQVTGELSTIDSGGAYFSVKSSDALSFTNIRADIDKSQLDRVKGFTKGQDVTFVGTVKDVGELMGYAIDVESIK